MILYNLILILLDLSLVFPTIGSIKGMFINNMNIDPDDYPTSDSNDVRSPSSSFYYEYPLNLPELSETREPAPGVFVDQNDPRDYELEDNINKVRDAWDKASMAEDKHETYIRENNINLDTADKELREHADKLL